MKKTISTGVAFSVLLLIVSNFLGTLSYDIGTTYCDLRHPEEAMTSSRKSTCEKQHIIQRQSGGGHTENVILINAYEHDYLDRSKSSPWEKNRPWLNFWGDDNLESAFMMGMYANGYHYQVYDYNGSNTATMLLKWDGASHAVYLVASLFNFAAKSLSYIGYQFKKKNPMYIDAVIGVPIDLVEISIGLGYSLVGMIVGTIWNPIDTVVNLIPAVTLIVESVVKGAVNTFLGLVSVVTLGAVSWTL